MNCTKNIFTNDIYVRANFDEEKFNHLVISNFYRLEILARKSAMCDKNWVGPLPPKVSENSRENYIDPVPPKVRAALYFSDRDIFHTIRNGKFSINYYRYIISGNEHKLKNFDIILKYLYTNGPVAA